MLSVWVLFKLFVTNMPLIPSVILLKITQYNGRLLLCWVLFKLFVENMPLIPSVILLNVNMLGVMVPKFI
jgi:hypothetical protein